MVTVNATIKKTNTSTQSGIHSASSAVVASGIDPSGLKSGQPMTTNYVFNEQTENTIAHLKSIFEKDRRKPVGESDYEEISKDAEYQAIVMETWDYCDKLPLSTVENAIVELSGENIGDNYTPQRQRIITDLEDYLKVRLEQGEYEV